MTSSALFIHPAWAFIALALALPFLRGSGWWRYLLLAPPLIAIWVVMTIPAGTYGVLPYLGLTL
ncbi:MAG: hypothetical protein P8X55_03660, partial [Desulfosarcinaceae bacterium]